MSELREGESAALGTGSEPPDPAVAGPAPLGARRRSWAERRPDFPARELFSRPAVLSGVVAVLVLAAVGALLGLLWPALSPRLIGVVQEGGAVTGRDGESQAQVGAQLVYAGLCLGAGLVVGLIAYVLARERGPLLPLGLLGGGLLGGVLCAVIGRSTSRGRFLDQIPGASVGSELRAGVELNARNLLVALPLGALLAYGIALAAAAPARPAPTDLPPGGGFPAAGAPISSGSTAGGSAPSPAPSSPPAAAEPPAAGG